MINSTVLRGITKRRNKYLENFDDQRNSQRTEGLSSMLGNSSVPVFGLLRIKVNLYPNFDKLILFMRIIEFYMTHNN